jgi:uncharacterized protein YbbC (DUF1343 family)
MKKICLLILLTCSASFVFSQKSNKQNTASSNKKEAAILPASYRTEAYIPLLKGKRVAVFANNTATIGSTHLVDSLLKLGVHIVKAFGPEHGFRGNMDDGKRIDDYVDSATNIPVISLFGKKRKPSAEDLSDVDVMLIDIQDVGTRFYTFISSVQEFIEAAFENSKPLIILDRPNPNGFYVDGPVLDTAYKSFVGMQPIPTVYGLTIGEYAMMIAGERWLSTKEANDKYDYYRNAKNSKDTVFHFLVIKCANYNHNSKYILPIKPSPNLPDMPCVYWYASNCLFEGTVLSEGRGTDHPFCTIGHPSLPNNLFSFIPTSRFGATTPKQKDKICYGWDLFKSNEEVLKEINGRLQLKYLLEAYKLFPDKENFFNKGRSGKPYDYGINRLAGSDQLVRQIIDGKTEEEIRASWQPKLDEYKQIRKKYLLYKDFD